MAQPALAVHGGAGSPPRGDETPYREALAAGLAAGWSALESRGALDAVQAAVESLEDAPLFNAGRGSVLTASGAVEMDAAIALGPGEPATRGGGGTVGAVARDAGGALAAATSTGGVRGQLPGRVGDTPLIGAGTYAAEACAGSAT